MDDRVTYFSVRGMEWPLCYSVGAQSEIAKRCGGIENLGILLQEKDLTALLANIVWVLAVLMKYGALRVNVLKRMEGSDERTPEPPVYDELLALIDVSDAPACQKAVMECLQAGNSTTVNTEKSSKKKAARSS